MKSNKNITSIFMVPTLGLPKGALKQHGFINGYNFDSHLEEQYEDAIYLLFKPTNALKFNEFLENQYEENDDIITDYDYPGGHVVLVYFINTYYTRDFNLVRKGQYSKTAKEFQELFPKKIVIDSGATHTIEESLQSKIFNKSKDLKSYWEEETGVILSDSQEVWLPYEIEKETLKL